MTLPEIQCLCNYCYGMGVPPKENCCQTCDYMLLYDQKDAADELTRLAQNMSVESNEKIRRVLATLDLLEWEANGTVAWPIVDSVTKRIRKVIEND